MLQKSKTRQTRTQTAAPTLLDRDWYKFVSYTSWALTESEVRPNWIVHSWMESLVRRCSWKLDLLPVCRHSTWITWA